MRVSANFPYWAAYLPPRAQYWRDKAVFETIEINFREIDPQEAPVSARIDILKSRRKRTFRHYDGQHWIALLDNRNSDAFGAEESTPVPALKAERILSEFPLQEYFNNARRHFQNFGNVVKREDMRPVSFEELTYREIDDERRMSAREWLNNKVLDYILINGEVWMRSREPVLRLSDRDMKITGLAEHMKEPSFFEFHPLTISQEELDSALDRMGHDADSIDREILMPEVFKWDKEFDFFMTAVNRIIDGYWSYVGFQSFDEDEEEFTSESVDLEGLQKWLNTKKAYDLAVETDADRNSLDDLEVAVTSLCETIPNDSFENAGVWKGIVDKWIDRPIDMEIAVPRL